MEMNRPAGVRTPPRAPDDDRAFDDPADLARPDETRDPAVADSENDENPHDLEGQDLDQHIDMGGEASLRNSDNAWARVEEIPDDIAALRKATPNRPLKRMTMTNRSLDNSTREVDVLEDLLGYPATVLRCRTRVLQRRTPGAVGVCESCRSKNIVLGVFRAY